ncbi:putative secreted protein [Corynebacterium renale]|uniref:DUF2516 family protein n=1 Tax=Corynebacterium renale TaxID=1724 RepID=UPI000DA377F3|nr:putative secreted protein [Corynebacterium renale]STD02812.1 putative secreted protein [Corynebacterium renale]
MMYTQILWSLAMVEALVFVAVGVAGLAGAIIVARTREDAFTAGDRQPKKVWLALLVGSALVCFVPRIMILSVVGCVIIGVYWFDVRPQLKDITEGNAGWY